MGRGSESSLETSAIPKDVSGAIRSAINILNEWETSPKEASVILGISLETYRAWLEVAPKEIGIAELMRISYVLGIWADLRTLYSSYDTIKRWPRMPNAASLFEGKPPIMLMMNENIAGLHDVRAWLDSWKHS